MHEHHVIVYVNEIAKTFTATARKQSARLAEVDDWAKANGFVRAEKANSIDEASAEEMKKLEIEKYEVKGYQYVTRPPL
ncbi:hypothetical protein VLK31_35640 [Variovorax sp. H27-G14]|uniref:hypothetical protein n=1 Tax=Variovorax sp. H27-G14 TaxID=3111914 RepID=UPI0038FD2A34